MSEGEGARLQRVQRGKLGFRAVKLGFRAVWLKFSSVRLGFRV